MFLQKVDYTNLINRFVDYNILNILQVTERTKFKLFSYANCKGSCTSTHWRTFASTLRSSGRRGRSCAAFAPSSPSSGPPCSPLPSFSASYPETTSASTSKTSSLTKFIKLGCSPNVYVSEFF